MAELELLNESGALGFVRELVKRDVAFMVAGASAAVLHGVPLVTQDIDLWFKDVNDPGIKKALKRVGGVFVPSFGHNSPGFAGNSVKMFDIVLTPQGLEDFDTEYKNALAVPLGTLKVPVLPLERVIESKRAAKREKDLAALPALETAQKTIELKTKKLLWRDYQQEQGR